ncbi:hypothetical protein [Streptomyces sp. NBC_00162]|uniref:hypothetical protein n=1 Tax=Streptomyces sp. NBC_00162 TaxID=2903629 RepID=UPI00214B9EC4|nr:hypothetical protein [Streptomyces sp. NBC_00162]UUU38080.1 hypothetical protein JIW86_03930 [Streptomyces sp. NBC_00162]
MTVLLRSKCGTAITPELAELAAVLDVSDDERNRECGETTRPPEPVHPTSSQLLSVVNVGSQADRR